MRLKKIGIAGYMGSGKSTFCAILGEMGGYKVINGDAEAKKIMMGHLQIQERLISTFGSEIIENRALSFSKLGTIVFNSMEKLLQLNTIVHPILLDSLRNMIFNSLENSIVVDAALLPIWNIDDWFDERIWINASSAIRLERILAKGILTDKETIRQRIQMQETLFAAPSRRSWKYIANEGTITTLGQSAVPFIHD
jgi:dephospho-CoA kinase